MRENAPATVLVFNCGSSSIKYKLFSMPQRIPRAWGVVERIGQGDSLCELVTPRGPVRMRGTVGNHEEGLARIAALLTDKESGVISSFADIDACGHRVVHGGEHFTASVIIDDTVVRAIEQAADLAPLHNPPNLSGIRAAMAMAPGVVQVACFDTAFHQTLPEVAYRYPLQAQFYETYRIRRYGFHGTSHRYVSRCAAEFLGRDLRDLRLVTCHLGNGCSVAAVRGGRCVDTSLGMTPLEGLMMGTRSGDIDPAIVLYLGRKGYTFDQLDTLLNKESGLLGVSGYSNDVRDLEERARGGDAASLLALELFAYRVRKYLGAYLAVLNGCDAVVFTGGIGENAVAMRKRILEDLDFAGIVIDDVRNTRPPLPRGRISTDGSRIEVLVIASDEELAIAEDTCAVLAEYTLGTAP